MLRAATSARARLAAINGDRIAVASFAALTQWPACASGAPLYHLAHSLPDHA